MGGLLQLARKEKNETNPKIFTTSYSAINFRNN